jgi:outer membrane protein
MKRLKTFLLLLAVVAITAQFANGQTALKFAHINNDELVRSMPEFDSAIVKLEKIRVQFTNDIELLQVELNNAYQRYLTEGKNWSDMVRQTKEEELGAMQQKIEAFQQQAQQTMQEQQTAMFNPIVEKAEKAVQTVGRENGFIYVFDVSKGSVIYVDTTKSTDITSLVKTKLGMK